MALSIFGTRGFPTWPPTIFMTMVLGTTNASPRTWKKAGPLTSVLFQPMTLVRINCLAHKHIENSQNLITFFSEILTKMIKIQKFSIS